MISRRHPVATLSLLIMLGVGVRAQNLQPTPPGAKPKAGTRSEPIEVKALPLQRPTNLQGFGVTGQIPKFGGGDFLVNSLIFESFTGNIGIGTQTPGSTLSVNGQIETLSGGIKFPDGTLQTTAGVAPLESVTGLNSLKGALTLGGGPNIAITPSGNMLTVSAPNMLTAVAHDATLTGEGTPSSPLRAVSATSQGQPFVAGSAGGFDGFEAQILLTTVPAGKRLVIEQVTANCNIGPGERLFILRLQIAPHDHYLLSLFTGTTGGNDFYASSQNVKFYAASGANVYLSAVRSRGNTQPASCEATLSGYLVDQP